MKEYIKQFYNEGLATTFYLKPLNFMRKYIKNEKKFKLINIFICILYTILAVIFAWFMFWDRYPL